VSRQTVIPIPVLSYRKTAPVGTPRRQWAAFFCIYLICAFISLAGVSDILDHLLFGRRGDRTAAVFCLISVAVVTAFTAVWYRPWIRRLGRPWRLSFAVCLGLGSVLPAYVVLLLRA
jgi:hypothetical protein